ncbi:hypothetical protein COCCADRAFT_39469 [Bipolaris zeicola 26-R-13]|uniref:Acetate transporter n=1 Tax=Cochliobolus carbonum (strain 26-R-13) TaxID=930089 RepID=W6XYA1_COCC2|nr:uncharacterized protein COCCADRAFT_39469 [Bipolaris zeicola 26-R-13]EUC30275.1 hypothetical protein COCCADRAFT_39469 [Bipolaris zeicola 26-R-13]
MANSPATDLKSSGHTDIERQVTYEAPVVSAPARKTLGSGTALPIGVFATTLTALSFSLMEWRGVTTNNVFIGLVITAQWELSVGNGFGYTVFSAFGLFYAGYGAILTPSFGIVAAYGDNVKELNNALGFFMIMWTVFALVFLVASLPTNLVYIIIFFTVELGFLLIAASYFAVADGHAGASVALKKGGGAFCFLSGLAGWYLEFALLLKDSIVELPLGDTSRFFAKSRKTE